VRVRSAIDTAKPLGPQPLAGAGAITHCIVEKIYTFARALSLSLARSLWIKVVDKHADRI
jgi:hypothetical protein